MFSGPSFTRVVDSLGNDRALTMNAPGEGNVFFWREAGKGDLYPGDILLVEVEVDAAYSPDEYSVRWRSDFGRTGEGLKAELLIETAFIGESFNISFFLEANREWHRFQGYFDDSIRMLYRVCPPPRSIA